MRLFLLRHGNTFGFDEKVLWIGAKTDLPLVETGRDQARAMGKALLALGVAPRRVLTGRLARTMETARIIAVEIGFLETRIECESELVELDYGRWEGKSADEIREAYGAKELEAWNRRGIWPDRAGWSPSESELYERISSFIIELGRASSQSDEIVLISSNGVFRAIARIAGRPASLSKMRTGSISIMECEGGSFKIRAWDIQPNEISERLALELFHLPPAPPNATAR